MSKRKAATGTHGFTREEQITALVLLCSWGSHAALNREDAVKVLAPFGLANPRMPKTKANVNPKGYLNPNLKRGTVVEVMGGWDAATTIAGMIGAEYESAFGRGTEFRRAVAAIKDKLAVTEAEWTAADLKLNTGTLAAIPEAGVTRLE